MKDKLKETANEDYQSWFFPEVSSPNTVATIEKEEKELAIEEAAKNTEESIEIVEDVEQDIAELISAEQLQKISEEAEQEGYQAGLDKGTKEGFETGQKQGLALAKKDTDDIMLRLHNLIEALLIPLKNEQDHLEKVVVKLVAQLVESIVGQAVNQPSTMIVDAVKKCLLALPHMTDHLTLYINSQDHQLIKASSVLSEYDCHIVDDDGLMLGGCRLVSSDSSIDYTIETRLKLLIDEFVSQPLADQRQSESQALEEKQVEQKVPEQTSQLEPNPESKLEKQPERTKQPERAKQPKPKIAKQTVNKSDNKKPKASAEKSNPKKTKRSTVAKEPSAQSSEPPVETLVSSTTKATKTINNDTNNDDSVSSEKAP